MVHRWSAGPGMKPSVPTEAEVRRHALVTGDCGGGGGKRSNCIISDEVGVELGTQEFKDPDAEPTLQLPGPLPKRKVVMVASRTRTVTCEKQELLEGGAGECSRGALRVKAWVGAEGGG